MYCPQCAQPVVNNAQFCARCGFLLEDASMLHTSGATRALPPIQSIPVGDFGVGRISTAEMAAAPSSITERTTSLLDER